MNDAPMHSTLREMRVLAKTPRSWAVLALLALAIGAVGPFGTFQHLALGPRLAYWAAIVFSTALVGTFTSTVVEKALRIGTPALRTVLAGLSAGPPVALTVAGINIIAFGRTADAFDLVSLLAYCTIITAAITLLVEILTPTVRAPVASRSTGLPEAARPALLDRVPRDKRGRLLHLVVRDHYVDVVTDRGTSLVLMRFADAMRETAPIPGLQVHRSHWVALDAVSRLMRHEGRIVLELCSGELIPVSRTYLAAVRRAGFPS